MNSKLLHNILLGSLILLCVGLVAGAYGVNSLLTGESGRLASKKAKSQALSQEEIALKKAKSDIVKYAELEKITRSVVPEDKNQAEAVREIVNIAAANNVSLSSIAFPASTLGNTPVGQIKTDPSAATPPATAATKTLSQLQPVKNIPGVYQLVVTVAGDSDKPVRYSEFINFLSALEHNRRTAQVSSITLQPDTANRNFLTFNLTLTEYIKP